MNNTSIMHMCDKSASSFQYFSWALIKIFSHFCINLPVVEQLMSMNKFLIIWVSNVTVLVPCFDQMLWNNVVQSARCTRIIRYVFLISCKQGSDVQAYILQCLAQYLCTAAGICLPFCNSIHKIKITVLCKNVCYLYWQKLYCKIFGLTHFLYETQWKLGNI